MVSLIQTLAVAEYLNFRHAANALGVAQSSVSARVTARKKTLAFSCSSAMQGASD
jgi:predicted transcriptional regulator